MSFNIIVSLDNPDPLECPKNLQELTNSENARLHGELQGSFIPYLTGAATPDPEDKDKVWQRVDASGRPLGTYVFFHGTWRRQYTGQIGQVVMYSGDPGVDFTGTGGAGTIGGEWDGWQLLNGQNGVANLSNKFIVSAKMDDLGVSYPSGGPWKTSVGGTTLQQADGIHEITLNANTTYRPATNAVRVSRRTANGETPAAGGLLGIQGSAFDIDLIAADPGNIDPAAIPTLPPYYALAFVIFRGYES